MRFIQKLGRDYITLLRRAMAARPLGVRALRRANMKRTVITHPFLRHLATSRAKALSCNYAPTRRCYEFVGASASASCRFCYAAYGVYV
jgi:hypothetical protein